MTFNEYLNLEIEESFYVFEYYLKYLEELSNKDFPFDEQLKLTGAGSKFINTIDKITFFTQERQNEYLKLLEKLNNELRYLRRRDSYFVVIRWLLFRKQTLLFSVQDSFQALYSKTLDLINDTKNKTSSYTILRINDFYKPENSNRKKITDLINDAIELIQDDITITEKTKSNIINYLKLALNDLKGKNTNWTRFLGRIKETIIVLGALGSFAGSTSILFDAQEKLEKTSQIVQNTSININYNALNETFNIPYIQNNNFINRLLEVPENNLKVSENRNTIVDSNINDDENPEDITDASVTE